MARTLEQLDEAVLALETQIGTLNVVNLDAQISSLTARLNAIDGLNLPPSQKGATASLLSELAGLRTTLVQTVLAMEGQLRETTGKYDAVIAQLRSLNLI